MVQSLPGEKSALEADETTFQGQDFVTPTVSLRQPVELAVGYRRFSDQT